MSLPRRIPDIEFRTEPGISSITAFAAAAGVSVNEGFSVSDGTVSDTKILLKVRKPTEESRPSCGLKGTRNLSWSSGCSFPDMKVYRNEDLPGEERLHERDVCPEIILKR